MSESRGVIVVTGAGGMGSAIARRIGTGSTVVLADFNQQLLEAEARNLVQTGYDVVSHAVDVSDKDSVDALAREAADRGPVTAVVHTAGLSPVQAPVDAILRVDLLGAVVSTGGAGVFISSMAGTMTPLPPDVEFRLATTPTDQLLDLADLGPDAVPDSATAYGVAKRANQVRVRAASIAWGRRGARVNSISPGIISTPMGASELEGPSGDMMRVMIAAPNGIGLVKLMGRDAGFITGTDLLVDGGVVASLQAPPS